MPSVTPALHSLIQALATTQTERELQLRFMDAASEPFGAQAWGLSLFDDDTGLHIIEVRGVPGAFLERVVFSICCLALRGCLKSRGCCKKTLSV